MRKHGKCLDLSSMPVLRVGICCNELHRRRNAFGCQNKLWVIACTVVSNWYTFPGSITQHRWKSAVELLQVVITARCVVCLFLHCSNKLRREIQQLIS